MGKYRYYKCKRLRVMHYLLFVALFFSSSVLTGNSESDSFKKLETTTSGKNDNVSNVVTETGTETGTGNDIITLLDEHELLSSSVESDISCIELVTNPLFSLKASPVFSDYFAYEDEDDGILQNNDLTLSEPVNLQLLWESTLYSETIEKQRRQIQRLTQSLKIQADHIKTQRLKIHELSDQINGLLEQLKAQDKFYEESMKVTRSELCRSTKINAKKLHEYEKQSVRDKQTLARVLEDRSRLQEALTAKTRDLEATKRESHKHEKRVKFLESHWEAQVTMEKEEYAVLQAKYTKECRKNEQIQADLSLALEDLKEKEAKNEHLQQERKKMMAAIQNCPKNTQPAVTFVESRAFFESKLKQATLQADELLEKKKRGEGKVAAIIGALKSEISSLKATLRNVKTENLSTPSSNVTTDLLSIVADGGIGNLDVVGYEGEVNHEDKDYKDKDEIVENNNAEKFNNQAYSLSIIPIKINFFIIISLLATL